MKSIVTFVALACAVVIISGCSSTCCKKDSAAKASCGMKCCADGKTTCANCPICSAKK